MLGKTANRFGFGFPIGRVGSFDADAINFIKAHENITGVLMDVFQKLAINGLVLRLKGNFTTNGTDFWVAMKLNGTRLFPLCPSSDVIASKLGYQMELLSATSLGTYNGFLATDILSVGAKGGVGKYFDTGISGAFYNQNSYQHGVYISENLGDTGLIGNYNAVPIRNYILISGGNMVYYTNALYGTNTGGAYIGNILMQRTAANKDEFIANGVKVSGSANTSNGTVVANILTHGVTIAGAVNDPRTGFYTIGSTTHNAQQKVDYNEAIQWYQANVITGGR